MDTWGWAGVHQCCMESSLTRKKDQWEYLYWELILLYYCLRFTQSLHSQEALSQKIMDIRYALFHLFFWLKFLKEKSQMKNTLEVEVSLMKSKRRLHKQFEIEAKLSGSHCNQKTIWRYRKRSCRSSNNFLNKISYKLCWMFHHNYIINRFESLKMDWIWLAVSYLENVQDE